MLGIGEHQARAVHVEDGMSGLHNLVHGILDGHLTEPQSAEFGQGPVQILQGHIHLLGPCMSAARARVASGWVGYPLAECGLCRCWQGGGGKAGLALSTNWRATSVSRWLVLLAWARSSPKEWSMSMLSRSASLPLACSITTRLFRAAWSCSATVSLRRTLRSCSRPMVATSARAWPRRRSVAPNGLASERNRVSAPMTWSRSR